MLQMDSGSRATIIEFLTILVWSLWALAIAWFWPVGPEPGFDPADRFGELCLVAAAFVGCVAYIRGEKIGDDHLNRWDEAVGLYGVDCLVDIAVMV